MSEGELNPSVLDTASRWLAQGHGVAIATVIAPGALLRDPSEVNWWSMISEGLKVQFQADAWKQLSLRKL